MPARTKPKQSLDDTDYDSLTDVSSILKTTPSCAARHYTFAHQNPPMNCSTYEKYVTDDTLLQSLADYTNSLHLDENVSGGRSKVLPDSSRASTRQRTVSSSIGNDRCEENSNVTTTVPSRFFSLKINHNNNNNDNDDADDNNLSDANTTITHGSTFDWDRLSEPPDYSERSSKHSFDGFHSGADDRNRKTFDYVKDIQEQSSANVSKDSSFSPVVVRVRIRCPLKQENQCQQYFGSPVSSLPSTPIIIREVCHRSSSPTRSKFKHDLSSLSMTSDEVYLPSRSVISAGQNINPKSLTSTQRTWSYPKRVIVEYDEINITLDREIRLRKEIKRVDPNQYLKQYGGSLHTGEAFRNFLTNIVA